ncbi:oxygen-independent coproporphyrinogen III oxidase [Sphingomonas lutea]|uniref:oxygen-independent coproporphyrinogen III oxidase n=1 Tax=Sphingomonas lutea TaxID=1045317 RepID=UPI001CB6C31C|nr:oxygen-independent coproporphyrinogen III oxidase [Sphingomonas lutea]
MIDTLSPDLLHRYAEARIPRYTSYPTAPNFSADVREAQYRSWLASTCSENASLYFHIPFCRAMCWYCGCHTTLAAREAPVLRYLDCLCKEVELVARCTGGPLSVGYVHFGGGTPTLVPPEQLRLLMADLRRHYGIRRDAEIAIEIDPRTLTGEMAKMLGACGFNRASLGVQSFDPAVQRAINRVQSFEETEAAVRLLRRNGIDRINFDLIYGLPLESAESCLATVEQALELGPDRFAVFGYAHVPSFKPHQRKIDEAALPDSEARFAHSRAIADALVGAGYIEVGFDHFALPGDPLAIAAASGGLHRNFQGYTTDDADLLIGFGASAIGRMPQGFVQNEVRIPEYQRLVSGGRLPIARGHRFTGDDRVRAEVIERLMCDHRADVGAICDRFGADSSGLLGSAGGLDRLEGEGLARRSGSVIEVTDAARPLVRVVAATFDRYLDAGTTYSRAI